MRVVYILAEYSLHNQIIVDHMTARPGDQLSLIKVPLVLRGRSRKETAARIVPKLSRRFLWGKLLEGLVVLTVTATPKLLRRGPVFQRLSSIARRHALPFLKTADVMSPEALSFISAQRPDVIVTLFHQIIRRELIGIPRFGVVNLHPGLIPAFRGIQPYFWELCEGSRRAGATLHFIEDEAIDAGRVLGRTSFEVLPGMSVQLNYYLTCRAAARLLPDCLAALEEGRLEPQVQTPDEGAYWRWPDSAAFDRLQAAGHCLMSWRQLFGLLVGRYDDVPASRELELRTTSSARPGPPGTPPGTK